MLQEIWNEILSQNTKGDFLIVIGIVLGIFVGLFIFRLIIRFTFGKLSKKTELKWDDILISFINGLKWPLYLFLALYIGVQYLVLPEILDNILSGLLIIFIGYYFGRSISGVVNYIAEMEVNKRKKKEKGGESMIRVFGVLVKAIIWILIFLMILINFGVEVTPLIAGLGVGGIAIAFALQKILGDLFSAFAIYLDKPFEEGDFIIVGDDMGVIKKVGIKSTRIEALGGQEIIMSNSDMVNSRINNYKKMKKRRIVFSLGVTYDTSSKKLEKINKIVEKVISSVEGADLDRVNFKEFGNFSLNYEIVYYVNTNDYNKYMDIQEKINLGIKKEFEKEKIEFAFPTQSIYLEK